MKTKFALLLGLTLAVNAHAFVSAPSGDPVNSGFRDAEFMSAVKVDGVTGYQDAISKGHAVFFEDGAGTPGDGYKVSRNYSGTYNTALASKLTACIAARDVASGDLGAFPCVTKGYVDYALYSTVASFAEIIVGSYLCVSNLSTSLGRLVVCGSGITSPFIALEAKTGTASGTIKIRVVSP